LLRALHSWNYASPHWNAFDSGHVACAKHTDDSRPLQGSSRVYFDDPRMRVRAAENCRMRHAYTMNIGNVFTDAAKQP
jgi:hypothetical protein